ncbi:MAG TPA: type II toxin-antitoxin system Phd/YefM family antitoxin [Thermoanaerobaculia bacterium]|nr:type II toxin-antitoxin system Phd/YefM family antitoxin [Thermoanaerobaculia bacterium]
MAYDDTLIPISVLAQNAASVLRQVKESRKPAVITHEGRPEAVLFSIEAYQQIEAERAILTRLAQGEREIADGEGYDLDHVLNEADPLLLLHHQA